MIPSNNKSKNNGGIDNGRSTPHDATAAGGAPPEVINRRVLRLLTNHTTNNAPRPKGGRGVGVGTNKASATRVKAAPSPPTTNTTCTSTLLGPPVQQTGGSWSSITRAAKSGSIYRQFPLYEHGASKTSAINNATTAVDYATGRTSTLNNGRASALLSPNTTFNGNRRSLHNRQASGALPSPKAAPYVHDNGRAVGLLTPNKPTINGRSVNLLTPQATFNGRSADLLTPQPTLNGRAVGLLSPEAAAFHGGAPSNDLHSPRGVGTTTTTTTTTTTSVLWQSNRLTSALSEATAAIGSAAAITTTTTTPPKSSATVYVPLLYSPKDSVWNGTGARMDGWGTDQSSSSGWSSKVIGDAVAAKLFAPVDASEETPAEQPASVRDTPGADAKKAVAEDGIDEEDRSTMTTPSKGRGTPTPYTYVIARNGTVAGSGSTDRDVGAKMYSKSGRDFRGGGRGGSNPRIVLSGEKKARTITKRCFKCGRPGHIAAECKKRAGFASPTAVLRRGTLGGTGPNRNDN